MSRRASRRRSLSLSALAAALVVAAVAFLVWRPSGPNPPSPSRRGGSGPATDEPPVAEAPAGPAPSVAGGTPRPGAPAAPRVVPREPLRLRGTVVAPDGRPVAGARVVADGRDDRLGGPARETARTDDRGAFALALRDAPEPVRVQAFGDGFAPSEALSLLSEGAAEPLALRLRAGGTIALRAVASDGGAPLDRAEVRVRAVGGAGGGTPVAAGPDGRASVGPLAAGRYEVRVLAPGRLPALRAEVVVAEEAVADLGDVALAAGVFVSGAVVDEGTGAPVAAVHVRSVDDPRGGVDPHGGVDSHGGASPPDGAATQGFGALPRTRSDARGRFRLGPLPPGATTLRLVKPGFEPRVVVVPGASAGDGPVGAGGSETALGSIPLRPRPDGALPEDDGPAGPGIGLRHRDGVARVSVVVPGSPAEAAGVRPGDRVVSVAGYPLEDVSPRDAVALLAGPRDSEVAVEVSGSGGDAVRALRLRRR